MERLFEAMDSGALVVTVNRRLSRYLQQRFDQHKIASGAEVWESPQLLPLTTWMHALWHEYCFVAPDAPRLIDQHQTTLIWQQVVRSSAQGEGLLNVNATARTAAQAWGLMQQWCLTPDDLPEGFNTDVDAFRGWLAAFQTRCADEGFIDDSALAGFLIQRLVQIRSLLPAQIILFGFDEITPQVERLLGALNELGVSVSVQERETVSAAPVRLSCESVEQELRTIAIWLKQLRDEDRLGRTAVVVPKPAELRPRIEAIFDDVLQPANLLEPGSANIAPYDISQGQPLAEQPIIVTALRLLELARGEMELSAFGRLLLSPSWAGDEAAYLARAEFDAFLRRRSGPKINLRQLRHYLVRPEFEKRCAELAYKVEQLIELREERSVKAPPSEWAERFKRLLQLLGWGTGRSLESNEFQAVEAWKGVLSQFAGFDQVSDACDYFTALNQLRRLAHETVFQPQSRNQPIQVLGSLEAAGMQFDNLWLMGLSDDVWPTTASANPFLPITLQVAHGMPHASAERELAFAQRMTDGFLSSAPNIVVSYCLRDGDQELRPSPLIEHLPETSAADLIGDVEVNSLRDRIYSASQLEPFCDWQAPPVDPRREVAGGTGILRDQAACPFRAFAKYRLGARGLEEPVSALAAADRGNLVHEVLEQLWLKLQDQATLLGLNDEQRAALINKVVSQVIEEAARKAPTLFTERYTALELERLQQMCEQWLALEAERAPFSVIETEKADEVEIGGLRMSVRVDRVDQLVNGEQMVIDYKTGTSASVAKWFDPRPEEPQLPLYCVARNQPVSALAFAQVNVRDYKYIGLSDELDVVKGIGPFSKSKYNIGKPDWQALIEEWRQVLERLAQAFLAGVADVDPKKYPTTCEYCELGALCRISEFHALGEDDDE